MSILSRALIASVLSAGLLAASPVLSAEREGWVRMETSHSYKNMVEKLNAAIKGAKMGMVTRASATVGAKRLGKTIPGNMVVGVYRPDFAIRMLEASVDAGIEAPIRFYLTENEDGKTKLTYVKPSTVFAPYYDEGGDKLKAMAAELDTIFDGIAKAAVK